VSRTPIAAACGTVTCVADARFSARRWELDHAANWASWIESPQTSRIERTSRLADAIYQVTLHWTACQSEAADVVLELPKTLSRCNELAFTSESETLAYTIWHLVDRYGRIVQVLDELLRRGHLPLRKTRLSVLEIGAGPSPALHAVRDFYRDLVGWGEQVDGRLDLTPCTHLLSLDHGAAWSHLVHAVSEELLVLGDDGGPHLFDITYGNLESFSVPAEHERAIDRLADWLSADADAWDEYLEPVQARSQAIDTHDYPPGAIDLIILCNFLTEAAMTRVFADELAHLADSLTPGGVLLVLGSQAAAYDEIFNDFRTLATRSGRVRTLFELDRVAPHRDPRVHEAVSKQIVACLLHLQSLAPETFSAVHMALPSDVQRPGETPLTFPVFRASAFKHEGRQPRGRWGRRETGPH
jgi:hypothetical protein